jgi:cytochrome oxidase assembly protein ShyY1
VSRYRFARRPRWVLSHVLALLAVAVMISLGFWQLRRLDERRDANTLIKSRSTEAALAVEDTAHLTPDDLRYRAVRATGTYDAAATKIIASRTQDGGPGGWVVTPMRVGAGSVLVLRGFERLSPDGSLQAPTPPDGTATVDGFAMAIDRFDPIAKKDLGDLQQNIQSPLPVVVQARVSRPTDDAGLAPVPLPDLGEGPHLGYAVQWFIFAVIAAVGYPLILRRAAQRESSA